MKKEILFILLLAWVATACGHTSGVTTQTVTKTVSSTTSPPSAQAAPTAPLLAKGQERGIGKANAGWIVAAKRLQAAANKGCTSADTVSPTNIICRNAYHPLIDLARQSTTLTFKIGALFYQLSGSGSRGSCYRATSRSDNDALSVVRDISRILQAGKQQDLKAGKAAFQQLKSHMRALRSDLERLDNACRSVFAGNPDSGTKAPCTALNGKGQNDIIRTLNHAAALGEAMAATSNPQATPRIESAAHRLLPITLQTLHDLEAWVPCNARQLEFRKLEGLATHYFNLSAALAIRAGVDTDPTKVKQAIVASYESFAKGRRFANKSTPPSS